MAKLSRPAYQLIAGALNKAYQDAPTNETIEAAEILADALERDNPAFRRDHFMAVIRGEAEVDSKPPRR
jgi:hypothetical protein